MNQASPPHARHQKVLEHKNVLTPRVSAMIAGAKERVDNTRRMIAQSKELLGSARKALESSKLLRGLCDGALRTHRSPEWMKQAPKRIGQS